MKKTFSILAFKLYCETRGEDFHNKNNDWKNDCEGLTEKECKKLGFGILDEWMAEENEK
jgi:hypothetical protein